MIILEIILSLVVGMWIIALIILPTNKLTKLDNMAKLDMKKNISIGQAQGELYKVDEEGEYVIVYYDKIGEKIYDTSLEQFHIKASEDKTYINIEDKKTYYSKVKYDKEDIDNIENKNKIYKSRKWIPNNKTMESVSYSKNEFETELRKYLENIKDKEQNIDIKYIKKELKFEKDSYEFSFNNPISKVDISSEINDMAYVSFVKLKKITKEIDRWKVNYSILKGDIELKYDDETKKIDLDENYEVNLDGSEKIFILYIPDISRK